MASYNEEWDTFVFKVQDRHFHVPKAKLINQKIYTGKANPFLAIFSKSDIGVSETNAYNLDDGTTGSDFQSLLSLLYPSGVFPGSLSKNDWISILRPSTRWNFQEIREHAITTLQADASFTHVEKISIGRACHVLDWVHSGLLALADSQDFITGSMARLLGDATVFRLYQIRERKGVATSRQDNDEGTFPDTYTTVADDVAHAFREELRGIYDASRAYRGNMEASERDTSTTQKRKANGDAGLPRAAPNSPAILAMEQIKPAVSDAPLNDPSPVAGPSHATSSGVSMDTQRVTFKVGSGDEMNVDQPSSPDNVPAVSSPCNRGSLTTPPVKRETIKHEHVNVKIEASRDVRIPLVQGTSLPDPGQPQTSKKDSPTAPSAGPSAGTSQASQNLNIESSTKQTLPSSIAEKIHTPTKPPPVATVKALAPKQPQTVPAGDDASGPSIAIATPLRTIPGASATVASTSLKAHKVVPPTPPAPTLPVIATPSAVVTTGPGMADPHLLPFDHIPARSNSGVPPATVTVPWKPSPTPAISINTFSTPLPPTFGAYNGPPLYAYPYQSFVQPSAFSIAPMAPVPSWGLLEQPVPEPHTKTQLEKAAEDAVPTASSSTMIMQTDGGKDLENTGGGKRRNSLPNKREARRTETRTDDQIPGRDGRRGHNGASFLEDLEANAIQRQWLGRERRSAAARKDHHACSIRYRSPEDTMAIREARSARHERRFETTRTLRGNPSGRRHHRRSTSPAFGSY